MDNTDELGKSGMAQRPKTYHQVLGIIAALAAISFVNVLLERIIQPSSLVFIYLIATIVSAFFFGTWAAIGASLGGLLIYDFLFVEPRYEFAMYHTQDIYNVTVYFVMALIVIQLIRIVQRQNLIVQFRLDRAGYVEDMSRDFLTMMPIEKTTESARELIGEQALDAIGKIIIRHTKKIIDVPMFVSFHNKSGPLKVRAKSGEDFEIRNEDLELACRAMREGDILGSGPGTVFSFIPLKSLSRVVGVAAIQCDYRKLTEEQQSLLRSLSNLASMVAEKWLPDS